MGWQLIYTSSSRLLEAGRSGFGTVARHREIAPLLAAAIERISQFNRVPGLNDDRIIYAHRHITVSGSRYSVLSRIRSAGADYTGRTNHIAHHLIFEAREIASLGRNVPTPIDVMLAAEWLDRWDEPPRYLGRDEEISLAATVPSAPGPSMWWEHLSGQKRCAALLATPEAVRGIYLTWKEKDGEQPEWPLYLFGESLHLIPNRFWAIDFTSNLQPSDEAADFQWRCISSGSSLRTQAEQTGRPVLDLDKPLPTVSGELAYLAEYGPVAKAETAPVLNIENAAEESESPILAKIHTSYREKPSSNAPTPIINIRKKSPLLKWLAITGAAVALIAVVGIGWLKTTRNSDAAKIDVLKNELDQDASRTKIDHAKVDQFWTENANASFKSLHEVITEFSKLSKEKANNAEPNFEKIRSLLIANNGFQPAKMKTWVDSMENLKSDTKRLTSKDAGQIQKAPDSHPAKVPVAPMVQATPAAMEPPEEKFAAESPWIPKIVTYVVLGNVGLAGAEFAGSDLGNLSLFLDAVPGPLTRYPSTEVNKLYAGAIWRFSIKGSRFVFGQGETAPTPPYSILCKNGDSPKLEIKVIADTDGQTQPVFGTLSHGLIVNTGSDPVLTIEPSLVSLKQNLPQQTKLKLEIPDGSLGFIKTLEFPNFSAHLAAFLIEYQKAQDAKKRELEELQGELQMLRTALDGFRQASENKKNLESVLFNGLDSVHASFTKNQTTLSISSSESTRLAEILEELKETRRSEETKHRLNQDVDKLNDDKQLNARIAEISVDLTDLVNPKTFNGSEQEKKRREDDAKDLRIFLRNWRLAFPHPGEDPIAMSKSAEARITEINQRVEKLNATDAAPPLLTTRLMPGTYRVVLPLADKEVCLFQFNINN